MKKRTKRAVTLIEIMIVILLIGLISGALAFNMRGSADKGRLFKTEQNCERVYDALMMASAGGEFDFKEINDEAKIKAVLKNSLWLKDGENLFKDGWGQPLKIEMNGTDDITVYSEKARGMKNGGQAR